MNNFTPEQRKRLHELIAHIQSEAERTGQTFERTLDDIVGSVATERQLRNALLRGERQSEEPPQPQNS